MSILFMESFDSGTVNPITDGGWKWQPGTAIPRFLFNPLIGKQGGGCRVHESGYLSHVPIPIPPSELPERLILQFDLYIDPATPEYNNSNSNSTYSQSYIGLYNYSGAGVSDSDNASGLRFLGGNDTERTGILRCHARPGFTGTNGRVSITGLPEGFWYNIAFEWEGDGFKVYVDGLLRNSYNSSYNGNIMTDGLGGIRLGPGSSSVEDNRGYCIIDNLILIADDGVGPSDLLGPVRVEALRPNSVESSEPWEQTPSGKSQSEILSGPLDFEEYVYTDINGRQLDISLATPQGPESILAVQQGVLARRQSGSEWGIGLSMGDTELHEQEVSEDPVGGPVINMMGTGINPLTNLPWTRQDLASTRWRITPKSTLQ